MVLQETYEIEDCHYWSTGINSDVSNWIKTGNISVTSGNDGITITESGSNERLTFPLSEVTGDSVFEVEFVSGNIKSIGIGIYQTNNQAIGWVSVNEWTMNLFSHMGTSNVVPSQHKTLVTGDKLRIVYQNGVLKSYVNDELIESVNKSLSSYRFGFYSAWDYKQTIKNIKIKAL